MRKSYTSEFKAKVAIEAIKGEMSIVELGAKFNVHPTLITNWKTKFLESASSVFSDKRKKENKKREETTDDLYKKIGQLQVERDFLRKKYKQIYGKDPD